LLTFFLKLKSDNFLPLRFQNNRPQLFNIEYVHILKSKTNEISVEDVLATLTRFSAVISGKILSSVQSSNLELSNFKSLSGGGMHNPLLVEFHGITNV
jgi:anhydro-N-acetylmuramic acid kinase